ncbi:MAG: response regulator transcription factor [Nitrospirae bacterium]|nr:MAG: response regulator transcription factor [Nitrospirota bacterium]
MIKVAIADDHPIVLQGIRQLLSAEPGIEVVAEASSAHEVLELLDKTDVDVVILDISLPDRSGLEVLDIIKVRNNKTHVLVLSAFPEEQYAIRALKSGASGYMTKNSAPKELIDAVRKVSRGGKYVSSILAEKLAGILTSDNVLPHENLSNRELQIMLMIASGKTTGEIARNLFISTSTVGTYRMRIMEKMQVKTNTELVRYAVEKRLIN